MFTQQDFSNILLRINLVVIMFLIMMQLSFAQSYLEVKSMSLNTRNYSEIAPCLYKEGILYTSNEKTNVFKTAKSDENEYFYGLRYFNQDKSIKASVDSMLLKINQPIFNVGPAVVYGDTFIVSQNFNIFGGKKYKAPVGVFFYDFSKNKNPVAKAFPHNNALYRVGHPYITSDSKCLYFSSNMPGGYGGFDIYMSERKDTSWSTPVNLGPNINSNKDEISPYFIANRLYFSSNRDSVKKFDVYYSEWIENKWQKSMVLPEPINSDENDFSFICDETFENGYFSSDRKKSDDIYHFYSTLPIFEQCDTMIEKNLCYHFLDETSQYLDTLPVIYIWHFGDSTSMQAWESDHCYADFGNYKVQLIMVDTITHETAKVADYDMILEKPIQPYITYPDTIFINKDVTFDSKESYLPDCSIKQYIWMFDDGIKMTGPTCTRQFKKSGNYNVRLGIVAIDKNKTEIKKCVIQPFEVKSIH